MDDRDAPERGDRRRGWLLRDLGVGVAGNLLTPVVAAGAAWLWQAVSGVDDWGPWELWVSGIYATVITLFLNRAMATTWDEYGKSLPLQFATVLFVGSTFSTAAMRAFAGSTFDLVLCILAGVFVLAGVGLWVLGHVSETKRDGGAVSR